MCDDPYYDPTYRRPNEGPWWDDDDYYGEEEWDDYDEEWDDYDRDGW